MITTVMKTKMTRRIDMTGHVLVPTGQAVVATNIIDLSDHGICLIYLINAHPLLLQPVFNVYSMVVFLYCVQYLRVKV